MRRGRKRPLGQALVDRGLVGLEQLAEGLRRQEATGERLGEALVCLRYLARKDLWTVLGAPWVDLSAVEIDWDCVRLFPRALLRKWQAIPVEWAADGTLIVAMADPLNLVCTDEMWRATRMNIRPCAAAPAEIARLLSEVDRRFSGQAGDVTSKSGIATEGSRPALAARFQRGTCDFCGQPVAEGEGGTLSPIELSNAWRLAVQREQQTGVSRHAVMADWKARASTPMRTCSECADTYTDASDHICAVCGRPMHSGEGGVVVQLSSLSLASVCDEMELRSRRCAACGCDFCLACGVRHGVSLGAEAVMCPSCDAPVSPARFAGVSNLINQS